MCGRLHVCAADVTELLQEFAELIHPGPDNLNAAPTEDIAVLVADADGAVQLRLMRWWLTPSWAQQPSTRYSMFNAKSETAATLPSFREPYKRQRCVVPVSGFYEWARRQGHKQAYFLRSVENTGLLLAGLWDRWQGVDDAGQSYSIDSFYHTHHRRQPIDADTAPSATGAVGSATGATVVRPQHSDSGAGALFCTATGYGY